MKNINALYKRLLKYSRAPSPTFILDSGVQYGMLSVWINIPQQSHIISLYTTAFYLL